ncbi:hypothetical protein P153DRAFT_368916 [Dothidotthia symphoricarpi CBS 119687]|uniref:BTB domain-containing protein n=1 Tax=Dothidotthia symphoricarpi CBS 119687 TaxID=1392245 RepID=A0A6A6A7V9_9PLEO|nr:uncharacterized protein P153DRAFT_368916 [Dothidotthia symphoricarpi CBS 119687]KAF2126888.1 hypothetical protein P153DRAFT_368916 [Dothidotthia symphoricarpi CBS 119687]
MGTKVIFVRVGQEPKHTDFTVHENIIRLSSPFFDEVLSREWRGPQEWIVRLPDCNAHTFHIYNQWLYTDQLHIKPQVGHTLLNDGQWEWDNLVKGYLLGEYLQDIDFKDTLMDAMIDWGHYAAREYSNVPPRSAVEVYRYTQDSSPLRKIVLDITCYRLLNSFPILVSDFHSPQDFFTSVLDTIAERHRTCQAICPSFADKKYCLYHCHGDRVCYKDKDMLSQQEAGNDMLNSVRETP